MARRSAWLADRPVIGTPRSVSRTASTTPQVRQLSAMLKVAKCCRSMKSTTAPRPIPGARSSRSHRFPTAPASSRPSVTAQPTERSRSILVKISMAIATARHVNSTVAAGAKEKAAPEFRET